MDLLIVNKIDDEITFIIYDLSPYIWKEEDFFNSVLNKHYYAVMSKERLAVGDIFLG